jgi:hypothetical protein
MELDTEERNKSSRYAMKFAVYVVFLVRPVVSPALATHDHPEEVA